MPTPDFIQRGNAVWQIIAIVVLLIVIAVVLVFRRKELSVEELAKRLGVPEEQLREARVEYKEAFVRKRSGGTRRLLIPSDELKSLQRRILRRLVARLKTHQAAMGFEPGLSIVDNAMVHAGHAVILKMDIVDFFPSTSADTVRRYFRDIGWCREAAELLTSLTTCEGGLPQGAPTSPRLSNLVNYKLDARIAGYAETQGATYSRYADDITIGFLDDCPGTIRSAATTVRTIIRESGYRPNGRKQKILRRHQQQKVTGLVVNDRVNVPRSIRRKLRAVEHRLDTGGRATMTREQLDGWKALLAMVEKQRGGG
jgi:retron-type reverse transcriptase